MRLVADEQAARVVVLRVTDETDETEVTRETLEVRTLLPRPLSLP